MFNTDNIKKVRIELEMSQEDVAKLLNVSRSSYAMWESNNNIFPIKRLIELCNIFNLSIDYALNLTNKNKEIKKDYNIEKVKIRLKELKKENNLTQEKISDFLHIDQPTWSICENGKSLIGTPFLYMIYKKYNVSADYLLGRSDTPKYLN